jgi:hypothetical protein
MVRREVVAILNSGGKYVVEGFVNGLGPVRVCVDTGADLTCLTDEIADAIGLDWRSGRKSKASGIVGTSDSWAIRVKSIRVGDIEVKDEFWESSLSGESLWCQIIPDMDLNRGGGDRYDGLLGLDFLGRVGYTQEPLSGKLILHDDSPETMPDPDGDQWWEKDKPKDEVDGSSQEDSTRDGTRKEELAQAEHEAKMAQIEFEKSEAERKLAWSEKTTPMVYDVDRDGDGEITREEKIAHETGGGVMGLWWLTAEEAVTIGVAAMLVIFTLGMGIVVSSGEVELEEGEGTVLLGTSWWEEEYEMEDCLYDEYYDEYYDCYSYYEYECGADVVYEFTIEGVIFSGEDGIVLGWWDDYCLEEVEFNVLPIGSTVTVWYDKENPENNQLSNSDGTGFIVWLCCMPFFLLLLVVTLVNARFSNSPKNFDHGESRIVDGTPGMFRQDGGGESVGIVHHHPGRWGWGRRMFGRPRRAHRSRSRVKTGGRSSGGRRSTGGGRRSGGGGRRSGGGGRRSSGGRRR